MMGRGSGKESVKTNLIKEKRNGTQGIWKEFIISIFFPRHCPICDEVIFYGTKICAGCAAKLCYIKEPVCKKCGKQLENEIREYCGDCIRKVHHFVQGKAVFAYRDGMKLSMYRFKYSNKREYADFFAQEAVRRYGKWLLKREIEVIVPVPMYAAKRRSRGYNQAEVFAEALGREIGIPVDKRLVKRVKNTIPQKSLNDRQRKDNLKGAFQVCTNIVKYKKILLVDDIYTTGATVDAVAEVLNGAGTKEVYFLCICAGEGY